MTPEKTEQEKLLPHHEQQDLCTTRLPYRQGRKLTAVKVYTINNESKHLLIFGVPSLNLRQETKSLFMKFGKLLQFNVTTYPSEQFTETFHAVYESIQSARIAKKMLDTKNYYGGNLHISYAPEFETVDEVKEKLMQRRTQVTARLKNLTKEAELSKQNIQNRIQERLTVNKISEENNIEKMNMGSVNTIVFSKRKLRDVKKKLIKKAKIINKNNTSIDRSETTVNIDTIKPASRIIGPIVTNEPIQGTNPGSSIIGPSVTYDPGQGVVRSSVTFDPDKGAIGPSVTNDPSLGGNSNTLNDIEVIDFTSTQTEVISNINDALNYDSFGSEIIKKVPSKPINKIKFNFNKNT